MDLTNLNKNKKDRRKPQLDISNMIYGKVPPQAKDLEEAVLGAIMLEGKFGYQDSAYDRVASVLRPEMFYVDAHQRIFKSIQSLTKKSQPIDILTVIEELRFSEELDLVGGSFAVTKLTNNVVSSANIVFHAMHIRERYYKREVIRICGENINDAYEDFSSSEDLLINISNELKKLEQKDSQNDIRHINQVLVDVFLQVEENSHKDERVNGVPSGFKELDKITNGWQESDLIIIGARPSKGKTAFALALAKNAAIKLKEAKRAKTGAGILSIEMKDTQNGQRMLASEAKMFLNTIRGGRLTDEQKKHLYSQGVQRLSGLDIYICDKARPALQKVRTTVRKMVAMGCGVIIIDYLQLINGVEGESNIQNREREIANISSNLKGLAKELNVPMIALSQLSREIENRSDGEPQLSDLRESGALEQDADMVLFLYSYSKNDIKQDAEKANKLLVKIAKHRNGDLGILEFEFDKGIQLITEIGYKENKGGTGSWRKLRDEETFPDVRTEAKKSTLQTSIGLDDNEDPPF